MLLACPSRFQRDIEDEVLYTYPGPHSLNVVEGYLRNVSHSHPKTLEGRSIGMEYPGQIRDTGRLSESSASSVTPVIQSAQPARSLLRVRQSHLEAS